MEAVRPTHRHRAPSRRQSLRQRLQLERRSPRPPKSKPERPGSRRVESTSGAQPRPSARSKRSGAQAASDELRRPWQTSRHRPPLGPKDLMASSVSAAGVDGLEWQVAAVRSIVERIGLGPIPIRPALCFTSAEWGLFSRPIHMDGAVIAWAKALIVQIRSGGPLDPRAIDLLARQVGIWTCPRSRSLGRALSRPCWPATRRGEMKSKRIRFRGRLEGLCRCRQ
jgi:hypothetical protein